MPGRCGWERWHDGGLSHREYYAGHQLSGLVAEEGLAERWEPDNQGVNVSTEAAVLDVKHIRGTLAIADHTIKPGPGSNRHCT